MCELDIDGDPIDDFKTAWAEASAAEICECCGAAIAAGERCRIATWVYCGVPDREVACAPCAEDTETFGNAHGKKLFAAGVEYLVQECVDDPYDDDGAAWKPMLERIRARRAAAKEARA